MKKISKRDLKLAFQGACYMMHQLSKENLSLLESQRQLQQVINTQRTELEKLQGRKRNICCVCGFVCDDEQEMVKHCLEAHPRKVVCKFCGTVFTGNNSDLEAVIHILSCDKNPLVLHIQELEAQGRQRDAYILEQSDVIGKHWARIQELEAKYEPITELTESPDDELNPDDFREEL